MLAGPSVFLFPLVQAKYNTEVWNRLYVVLLGKFDFALTLVCVKINGFLMRVHANS